MAEDLRFTTIEEVVSIAQMNVGMDTPVSSPIMRQWAYQAQRSIGLCNVNKKTETHDIENFTFPIPCDLATLIEIRLNDKSCNDCDAFYLTYRGDKWEQGREDCANKDSCIITVSMQDGKFHLSSNSTAYNCAEIYYYGLPLDKDDLPLIPEYNQRAVVSYIEWMWIKKERFKRPNQIRITDVRDAYNSWVILKLDAIGYKNTPSVFEWEEIAKKWYGIIPEYPLKNRFSAFKLK